MDGLRSAYYGVSQDLDAPRLLSLATHKFVKLLLQQRRVCQVVSIGLDGLMALLVQPLLIE